MAKEITLPTAREMVALGAGILIDVRQGFELETEGAIPGAIHVPLFTLKSVMGKALKDEEREALDAGTPDQSDAAMFVMKLNKLYFTYDRPAFLCLCSSGRRSLYAAELLASLGYNHSYSVKGGYRAWRYEAPDPASVI